MLVIDDWNLYTYIFWVLICDLLVLGWIRMMLLFYSKICNCNYTGKLESPTPRPISDIYLKNEHFLVVVYLCTELWCRPLLLNFEIKYDLIKLFYLTQLGRCNCITKLELLVIPFQQLKYEIIETWKLLLILTELRT